MKALYKHKVTYIKPFTHELKSYEKGIHEDFTYKEWWEINENRCKGLYHDFRYKYDKFGVKEVDFTNRSGDRFLISRTKLLIDRSDKKEYYKKRMNDSKITKKQREYAKQMFTKL
jgi:hypothetical protein